MTNFSKVSFQDLLEQTLGNSLLFSSAKDFSYFIEKRSEANNSTCTQTILEYCDAKDIEPEEVSKLISPSLRGKLQMEMIEAGLLPEHNTLYD